MTDQTDVGRKFRSTWALLLAGLALAAAALAESSPWSALGPIGPSGEVTAIAVDPFHPATLYAGIPGGIFKSTDRGASWSPANGNLGQGDFQVTAIVPDPSSASVVYVATLARIFKTTDGAMSWTALGGFPLALDEWGAVNALAVDPASPGTLYAALSIHSTPFPFPGPVRGQVFKSTDDGEHWTGLPQDFENGACTLRLDPQSSFLYATSTTGEGQFVTADGGATWQPTADYLLCGTSVAVDPTDPRIVYRASWSQSIFPGVHRSLDAGVTWSAVNDGLTNLDVTSLAIDPVDPSRLYAGTFSGVFTRTFDGPAGPLCAPSPTTLCLVGNRFKAEVSWSVPSDGRSGAGRARPLTSDTGSFWFFSEDNIELVLKVLDGRTLNGSFWVFYGALSNVQYTITVSDTETGAVRTYENPSGELSSRADTSAFPEQASLVTRPAAARAFAATEGRSAAELYGMYGLLSEPRARRKTGAADCAPGSATLCLGQSRFRVTVAWEVPDQGRTGTGVAVPVTGNTGYFWFFDNANVELMIKVLDGDAINGHQWVFYGALSNVKYTVTVKDTSTGAILTYDNASGELASVADTAAF